MAVLGRPARIRGYLDGSFSSGGEDIWVRIFWLWMTVLDLGVMICTLACSFRFRG